MLRSFEIERFRTFSHLRIEQLGRVNLVVGRNNVGKSMLLEALRLYATGGHPAVIANLLYERDEVLVGGEPLEESRQPFVDLQALFHGGQAQVGQEGAIRIGACKRQRMEGDVDELGAIQILDSWALRLQLDPVGKAGSVGLYVEGEGPYFRFAQREPVEDPRVPYVLSVFQGDQYTYSLTVLDLSRYHRRFARSYPTPPTPPFVVPQGVNSRVMAQQWDAVTLRQAEERVKECLRIVAPVEKIGGVKHPRGDQDRMFIAWLPGTGPLALKSLGDGMVRVFQVALALESAAYGEESGNGPGRQLTFFSDSLPRPGARMLLIDEIENGIHYTLLPELWRFILGVAKLRDVQVFATTHSWDCVEAFQTAASQEEEAEAVLIRLERKGETHQAVTFTQQELSIVTRDGIEVR